jgi:mannose/fructose/N-acetylgalactosamine-specific phosphotransferase system component IID
MGLYFKLGQSELARALDIQGRNKAVQANLLPLLSGTGWAVYWLLTKDFRPWVVLLAVLVIIGSLMLGVRIQAVAVIQSVYRCKDGKNKKIYQKHKHYFDKQFKKHCQALHKSEQK